MLRLLTPGKSARALSVASERKRKVPTFCLGGVGVHLLPVCLIMVMIKISIVIVIKVARSENNWNNSNNGNKSNDST